MTTLIEKLINDAGSDEQLDLEGFIAELRANPEDWSAFRHAELEHLVRSIVIETVAVYQSVGIYAPAVPDILERLYGKAEDV